MIKSERSLSTGILGAGGVGKSALTLQFIYGEFVSEYEPTKSDAYVKTLKIGEDEWNVSIADTAGQEDYDLQRDNYIRTCEGFYCVFSLLERETFDAMDDVLNKIIQIKGTNRIIAVLVGNKKDIVDEDESKRKVPLVDAQTKADKYKIRYMETSAKTNANVADMFTCIIEEVIAQKPKNVTPQAVVNKKKKRRCDIL